MNTIYKYLFFFLIPTNVIYYGIISYNAQSSPFSLLITTLGILLLIYTVVNVFILVNYKKQTEPDIKQVIQPTSVDIFLPICGEKISILRKTWTAVTQLKKKAISQQIKVNVFVLDDTGKQSLRVKNLAKFFKFNYVRRKNVGHFKKAGNIKNAFDKTKGEYILILDADFAPVKNFFAYTLPKMQNDKKIGILQTPQAFNLKKVNSFEFGTSAVQDFFYEIIQNAFSNLGACICVGTNAVYRRSALDTIGGIALISHSEDVWTGFKLSSNGFKVEYLHKALAFGRSPDGFISYFKQQIRWCQGSLSLMSTKEFWNSKMPWMSKLSFISGFMYYLFSPIVLLHLIFTTGTTTQDNASSMIGNIILASTVVTFGIYFTLIQRRFKPVVMVVATINLFIYTFTVISYFLKLESVWVPSGGKHKRNKEFMRFYWFFIGYLSIYSILVFTQLNEILSNPSLLFWHTIKSAIFISMLYFVHADQLKVLQKNIVKAGVRLRPALTQLTVARIRSLF
jgi:cellulose synthase (UDP-forming)